MLFIKKPKKLAVMSLLFSIALALTLELGMSTQPISATGADKVATLSSDHNQGQMMEAGFWDGLKKAWTFVTRVTKCASCLMSTYWGDCGGENACGGDWW